MKRQRWVIKAGSQMVCSGGPLLLRSWMRQVITLQREFSLEIVWVTSGAIASAVERTNFQKSRHGWSLAEKQALSAIGQPILMGLYNLAMHDTGLLGSQILLTYNDLAKEQQRKNFRHSLDQLLKWNVIPILNENDAVAIDEIKFGDNDTLSARVAKVVGAHRLIILTDVDGLCDKDPRVHSDAQVIPEIKKISPKLLKSLKNESKSKLGTGGMFSKIMASQLASKAGIDCFLVKGDKADVLLDLARGKNVGTHIRGNK